MLQAPRPENTGRRHEDTVNVFCNKLEVFTHGFAHLHKADLSLNDKLVKIDAQIAQKVNTPDFRAKVKKTKTKLRTKVLYLTLASNFLLIFLALDGRKPESFRR